MDWEEKRWTNGWIIYQKVNTLKDEERIRRGWILRNVPGRLESVSEHCFAMTNLAILINLEYNLNLDMERVLTMINIHEYGEVEVGDLTPFDNVSKAEKYQRELNAITALMKESKGSTKAIELWKEFETKETDEAVFVFLLDKFQSVIQAKEYADKYQMQNLYEEFLEWYQDLISEYKTISPKIAKILIIKKSSH